MFYCNIFGTLQYLRYEKFSYIISYFDLWYSEISAVMSVIYLVHIISAANYFIYFVK
jgi:hypothetical protein